MRITIRTLDGLRLKLCDTDAATYDAEQVRLGRELHPRRAVQVWVRLGRQAALPDLVPGPKLPRLKFQQVRVVSCALTGSSRQYTAAWGCS
jgi:hypothetical protein